MADLPNIGPDRPFAQPKDSPPPFDASKPPEVLNLKPLGPTRGPADFLGRHLAASEQPLEEMDRTQAAKQLSILLGVPFSQAYANFDDLAAVWQGKKEIPQGFPSAIGLVFKTAWLNTELAKAAWDQMHGDESDRTRARIEELKAAMPAPDLLARSLPVQWLKDAAQLAGNMAPSVLESLIYDVPLAAASAAVSSGATAPGALAKIAMKLIGAARVGAWAYPNVRTEAGSEYLELVDRGVSADIAKPLALSYGTIAGALETLGERVFIGLAPGASSMLGEAAEKAITKALASGKWTSAGARIAGRLVYASGAEATTEAAQELAAIVTEDLAASWNNEVKGTQFDTPEIKEKADRVFESFRSAFTGSLVLGLPVAGARVLSEKKANQTATTAATQPASAQQPQQPRQVVDVQASYDQALAALAANPADPILVRDARELARELTDLERPAITPPAPATEEPSVAEWLEKRREEAELEKARKDQEVSDQISQIVSLPELEEALASRSAQISPAERRGVAFLTFLGARAEGVEPSQYLERHFAPGVFSAPEQAAGILTTEGGLRRLAAVDILEDGKALVHIGPHSTFKDVVHEWGHVFRRQLSGEDLAIVAKAVGAPQDEQGSSKWGVEHEEKFTELLLDYLETGSVPEPGLQTIFEQIAQWLKAAYREFRGVLELAPEVKDVFDRFVRGELKREVKPAETAELELFSTETVDYDDETAILKYGSLEAYEEAKDAIVAASSGVSSSPLGRGPGLGLPERAGESRVSKAAPARVDYVGQRVKSPEELAALFQVYRDPRIEHFHLVYVNRQGKILAHNAISSGLPGRTIAVDSPSTARAMYRFKKRMEQLGASGYYLLHNHPSGDPTPSPQDVKLTQNYVNNADGFKGHVIIDHGKASVLSPDAGIYRVDYQIDPDLASYVPSGAYRTKTISNSEMAAQYAHEVLHDGQPTVALVLDNQHRTIAWVPTKNVSPERIHQIYEEMAGSRVVLVTADQKTYWAALNSLDRSGRFNHYLDIVLVDPQSHQVWRSAHTEGFLGGPGHTEWAMERLKSSTRIPYSFEAEPLYDAGGKPDELPAESPWRLFSLEKESRPVTVRSNLKKQIRVYEVSSTPEVTRRVFGKSKKAPREIATFEQARELNSNPERRADWQILYRRALEQSRDKGFTKFGDVKKVGEFKLDTAPIIMLTKGCQRAQVTVERVQNGILPNETAVEACYGGTCWVNRQFNRAFGFFENMEVRDLLMVSPENIEQWFKRSTVREFLNSGPFIREGQQGCSSHAFVALEDYGTSLAEAWHRACREAGVTNKTVWITAAYAPVTEEDYRRLLPYREAMEIHVSVSGWFHQNELMIRLAEFKTIRDIGLPVALRLITNKDGIGGLEMPNHEWLLEKLKELKVTQEEVLETPYHDDTLKGRKNVQDRSEPTELFKYICCETGKCATCGAKCLTRQAAGQGPGSVAATATAAKVKKEKSPAVTTELYAPEGTTPSPTHSPRADKKKSKPKKSAAQELTNPEARLYSMEEEEKLWLYKAEEVVRAKMPDKGSLSGAQLLKLLANSGVKPEELLWTGLRDYLEAMADEQFTKEDFLEGFEELKLPILESISDDDYLPKLPRWIYSFMEYENDRVDIMRYRLEPGERQNDAGPVDELYEERREVVESFPWNERAKAIARWRDLSDKKEAEIPRHHNERYYNFSLAKGASQGVEGYNEYLMIWKHPKLEFLEHHWGDIKNVLAHARHDIQNAYTMDDAVHKTLFIEELQSDWHQKGRDKGYQRPANTPVPEILRVQRSNPTALFPETYVFADGSAVDAETKEMARIRWKLEHGIQVAEEDWPPKEIELRHHAKNGEPYYYLSPEEDGDALFRKPAWASTREEAEGILRERRKAFIEKRLVEFPPEAPLKKTWHEALFRRMLRVAADRGLDAVAWTTGETLAPVIGREFAERIVKDAASKKDREGWSYQGLEIDTGTGGGMSGFYDKILVDYANKLGKKYGVAVEEGRLTASGIKAHLLRLPSELIAEVRRGIQLFSKEKSLSDSSPQADASLIEADVEARRWVPDGVLERFSSFPWAERERERRAELRRAASEAEATGMDAEEWSAFNLTMEGVEDATPETADYYGRIWQTREAAKPKPAGREEANAAFLEAIGTPEALQALFATIARAAGGTETFSGIVASAVLSAKKGAAFSREFYDKLMDQIRYDVTGFRRTVAALLEDREEYQAIEKEITQDPLTEELEERKRQIAKLSREKEKQAASLEELERQIKLERKYGKDLEEKLKSFDEALKSATKEAAQGSWKVRKELLGTLADARKEAALQTRRMAAEAKAKVKSLQAQKAEVARLIRIIMRPPAANCDYAYKVQILEIQADYELSTSKADAQFRALIPQILSTEQDPARRAELEADLRKVNLRRLSIEELMKRAQQIVTLKIQGRAEYNRKKLLRIQQDDADIEALVAQILEGKPLEDLRRKTPEELSGSLTDKVLWTTVRMNRLAEWMGPKAKELLWDLVNAARDEELRRKDERFQKVAAALKASGISWEDLRRPALGPWTLHQAIGLYIALQNEDSMKAAIGGNGLQEREAEWLVNRFDKKYHLLAKELMKVFSAEDFQRLQKVYIEDTNDAMKRVENYFPMKRQDWTGGALGEEIASDLLQRGGAGRAYPWKKFALVRQKIKVENQRPIRLDAGSIALEAIDKQEHYIAFSPLVKRLQRVFGARETQEAIVQRYGKEAYGVITRYINRIANPTAYKAYDLVDRAFATLLTNTQVAALAFNLVSVLKNVPGLLLYLGESGPVHLASGVAQVLTQPRKTMEFVYSRDPQAKNRVIDPFFEQLRLHDKSAYQRLVKSLGSLGTAPLHLMDTFTVLAGWKAVYDSVRARGGSEAEAVKAAQDATLRTQPAGSEKDLPDLYKSERLKPFLLFTNQANQVFNMLVADIPQAAKKKDVGKILWTLIALAATGVIMGAIKRRRPPEKPEEWVFDILSQPAGALPIVGSEILPILEEAVTGKSSGPLYGVSLAQPIVSAAKAAASAFDAESSLDRKVASGARAARDAAKYAGLPSVAAWRLWKTVVDDSGDLQFNPWELVGGEPEED